MSPTPKSRSARRLPWRSAVLPGLGACALIFASWSILRNAPTRVEAAPLVLPPVRPVVDGPSTAGVGLVEPASEIIALAPHVSGVVSEVQVRPGDRVTTGAVILRIEDREIRRQLESAEAQIALEKARLSRLVALPRTEELPPLRARLEAARAELREAKTRFDSRQRVGGRFVAPEEIEIARQGVLAASARVDEASASLSLLEAGTWLPELAQQKAAVAAAEAEGERVRSRLELHTVRAPIAGTILRVSTRVGEFAATGETSDHPVEMGDLSRLHVRVEVDEEDLPRLNLSGKAVAYPRGDGRRAVPLAYVRLEPSLRPKRNLSGASTERIDTRIAEILYRVEDNSAELPVGRQLDVYILGPESVPPTPSTL